MNKILILVDLQNDFVTGPLGTPEAQAIIPNVVRKIQTWDGDIRATKDIHGMNYLDTKEGKNLPVPHCIFGTEGHKLHPDICAALDKANRYYGIVNKITFGSTELPEALHSKTLPDYDEIHLCGVCTGICVLSNAIILKAHFPEAEIIVDASCCACVTPESHKTALESMKLCQIRVENE